MRPNGSFGMTLMELVVVMGLISILLIGTIPRLIRSDKEVNLAQAVGRLTGFISRLKEDAVRDGRIYVLTVDLDNRQAWIEPQKNEFLGVPSGAVVKTHRGDRPEPILRISDEVARMSLRFLNDDPEDSGLHEIHFYPQGYSSAAAIWLETRHGAGVCLKIEPFLAEPALTVREACEQSRSLRSTEPKKNSR